MENPIKMDDLGVPLFSETSICVFRWSENCFPFLFVEGRRHSASGRLLFAAGCAAVRDAQK